MSNEFAMRTREPLLVARQAQVCHGATAEPRRPARGDRRGSLVMHVRKEHR